MTDQEELRDDVPPEPEDKTGQMGDLDWQEEERREEELPDEERAPTEVELPEEEHAPEERPVDPPVGPPLVP